MTTREPLPTTTAEAHRWVARWALGPHQLLQAYAGDLDGPRRDITSGMGARGGGGWEATVHGHRVDYRFDSGPTGSVKIVDLLRLAARCATRGAVDRLTEALAASRAVADEEEALFGPYYTRSLSVVTTPEWAAHIDRGIAALRAIHQAEDAWWDGAPGEQLDLFGAAS